MDIQTTVSFHSKCHELLPVPFQGDILLEKYPFAAIGQDFIHTGLPVIFVNVGGYNLCTFFGQ